MKQHHVLLRVTVILAASWLLTLSPSLTMAQKEESRSIETFESLSLSVRADVYLRQENKTSLKIIGSPEVVSELETEVEGSTLKIRFKNRHRWGSWRRSYKKLTIYLSSPEIKNLSISGSGTIHAETPIKTDIADYKISGSGNIVIDDLSAKEIGCYISGSGDVVLKGDNLDVFKIQISGSGDVDAEHLKAREVSARISGSGDCKVHATKELNAKVAGSGDIYYRGKPDRLDVNSSGSGHIRSIN